MIGITLLHLAQISGDTLRWYNADSADWSVAGLIIGPYCHWAIKFVIDPSLDGRTLHSGKVYIWDPGDSLITMRLCRGTASNPGVVLDSGSLYATVGHSFYEVPFGDTIILNRGDTIWLWCYQTRITGEWPWTIDGGPAVPGYGDRISFDGAVWEGLNDYGFNSNWVMELILTPLDVKEGPARPDGKLTLLPAPGGFWITGYEGPALIYDPAGRLVLSKEIKGKTLISPLRPGVYFVVAGKQRARVAIR